MFVTFEEKKNRLDVNLKPKSFRITHRNRTLTSLTPYETKRHKLAFYPHKVTWNKKSKFHDGSKLNKLWSTGAALTLKYTSSMGEYAVKVLLYWRENAFFLTENKIKVFYRKTFKLRRLILAL